MNRNTVIAGALVVIAALLALSYWLGSATAGGDGNNKNAAAVSYTATPQTTATPTPEAQLTVAAAMTSKCPGDHVVNTGQTYDVPAGCNVKGDVIVNGKQLYDDDPATGLIVSCPNGCTITAPWGANVSPRTVGDLKSEMRSTGCGDTCVTVKVVTIGGTTGTTLNVTDLCDVSLPKGSKALVSGGCAVSGDVEAASSENGPFKALYDSDQTTGLVVVVKSDTWIRAPYGASVTNAAVDDVVNAVEQTGCGLPNGCRVVNTVTVP